MTPQSTFLIIAPIREGHLQQLRSLLCSMNLEAGLADPDNDLVPFGRFEQLHVARFVILELHTQDDIKAHGRSPVAWTPSLAFLGDCDGDAKAMFTELARHAEPGLRQIFSHCQDFSEGTYLRDWMQQHNLRPHANYINWIGRTVRQIHEEEALHRSLAACLPDIVADVGPEDYRAIRQKLLSHVEIEKAEHRLTLTPPEPTPFLWRIKNVTHAIAVPLVGLLLAPLFLLASPFLLWHLRNLERSDPELFVRPDHDHIRSLSELEDRSVSNQFNVLGDVKPGLFRLVLLRVALILLNYSTRHIYKRGYLTRVKTIHFARWVLIDHNRRLFFASNYDGSLESYMDDFINKVAWGLNLVFSNGVAYPRTRWLIKDGAEREQQFKHTLRRHQLPSQVWYKAYPDLTAFDLWRNSRIRAGVEVRQGNEAAVREWLRLI